MEFIKDIFKNKSLILRLGKNDFKNRFAGTSLGAIWGFVQPFIFMMTYVIVFQYILKSASPGEYPFIVWYLPGMAMWQFISDSISSVSSSIRSYSYLVKKVVFPVNIIPIITLTSSSIIAMFLFTICIIVGAVLGYMVNILMLVYVIFAAYCFIISFTRLTSAICALISDFGQLLSVIMQLGFWLTPIMWNISMLEGNSIALNAIKCSPFAYLVTAFREAFVGGTLVTEKNFLFTGIFWGIVLLFFIWGNSVFKRSRKDFADVI